MFGKVSPLSAVCFLIAVAVLNPVSWTKFHKCRQDLSPMLSTCGTFGFLASETNNLGPRPVLVSANPHHVHLAIQSLHGSINTARLSLKHQEIDWIKPMFKLCTQLSCQPQSRYVSTQ